MDGVDGPEEWVVLGTNGGGMMESPLRFIMMTGFWVPSFDIRVATGVEFPEAAFGSPSSGERRTTVGAAPSGMGLGVLEVDDTKSWWVRVFWDGVFHIRQVKEGNWEFKVGKSELIEGQLLVVLIQGTTVQ
jgi:hypothetical protein